MNTEGNEEEGDDSISFVQWNRKYTIALLCWLKKIMEIAIDRQWLWIKNKSVNLRSFVAEIGRYMHWWEWQSRYRNKAELKTTIWTRWQTNRDSTSKYSNLNQQSGRHGGIEEGNGSRKDSPRSTH